MHELTTFTTGFDRFEDRIRILAKCADGAEIELWLTRRLLDITLPVILAWVEREVPGQAASQLRQAPATPQVQQFMQDAARQALPSVPPVRVAPDSKSYLPTGVDLFAGEGRLRLVWKCEEAQVAAITAGPATWRQWLGSIYLQVRGAAWRLDVWPDWLRQLYEPEGGAGDIDAPTLN